MSVLGRGNGVKENIPAFRNRDNVIREQILATTFALSILVSTLTASAAPAWTSPPTVAAAAKPIVFKNAGATLRGTLYVPEVGHPVPAVVVFHGASEPLARTPLYRHLRDGLPAIGIAVLIFDRRGTGASSGTKDVAYQTLAGDGIAGADAIRALPDIDSKRVGYWGISQGGWLATLAASRDPRAAFAVAVSAPLVPAETQMEFAMSNRLEVLGYSQLDVRDMLSARKAVDGYYSGANGRAAAVAALEKIQNRPWFKLMYLPNPSSLPANPAGSSWTEQMDVDFFAAVERVKIPILFILGSSDPWIPVSLTVDRLRDVARERSNLAYVVVPNANHLMMTPPAHERMNDADPQQIWVDRPESTAYFMVLAAWLGRTSKQSEK